eukprot:23455_1
MGSCCQPQGQVSFHKESIFDPDEPNTPMQAKGESPPPATSIENYFSLDYWKNEIIATKSIIDINKEYNKFINNLAYPSSSSPFYISIITRVIHHYTDIVTPLLLCESKFQLFDGLKFTAPIISPHPITGKLFMADDYTIYILDENDTKVMDNKRLKQTIEIPNHYDLNHDIKITNISFNGDGKSIFAILNNNDDKIHYIDQKTKTIFFNKVYDKSMDILRYNFNSYFLTSKWLPQFFLEVVNTIIP